jgi:hypothetical protein
LFHVALGEPAAAEAALARLERVGAGPFPPQILEMARDFVELARSGAGTSTGSPGVTRLLALSRGEGELFPYWAQSTQLTAPVLADLGRNADALEVLEARTALGVVEPYDLLLWNPAMDSLHSDPGLDAVLAASRERFDATVSILEAARERNELPAYLDTPLTRLLGRLEEE